MKMIIMGIRVLSRTKPTVMDIRVLSKLIKIIIGIRVLPNFNILIGMRVLPTNSTGFYGYESINRQTRKNVRSLNSVSLLLFKELNRIFWVKDKLRSTTSPWKEDENHFREVQVPDPTSSIK